MTTKEGNELRVMISTLYADRKGGAAVSLDRMTDSPDEWLRDHDVYSLHGAEPVVIMLDNSESRATHGEYCDTVALHGDNDRPLLSIERAIAALEMTHAALVAAGSDDFVPRGVDSTTLTCPGCGVKVVGHERCGDPTRPECWEGADR